MQHYQLFLRDEHATLLRMEEIFARDDDDAAQTALTRFDRYSIEIWKDGARIKSISVRERPELQLRDAISAALRFNVRERSR